MVSPEKLLSSKLGKPGKKCPRCGRLGSFHIKEFLGEGGQVYRYWYTAHYKPVATAAENGKKSSVKWCYIGKSLPSGEPDVSGKDDSHQRRQIKSINRESLYLNCDASGKQQRPVQLSQIRHNREREKT